MTSDPQPESHDGASRGGRTSNPVIMVDSSISIEADALGGLEQRLSKTYKARVQTARRYQLRGNYWNVALVIASLTTTTVSIVNLVSDEVYGNRSDALLVVLGVVTLVVSVLVSSAQFSVNAEKFFRAYRGLQKLWVEAHRADLSIRDLGLRNSEAERIDKEYQEILDDTGNHSPADFYRAFPAVWARGRKAKDPGKSDVVGGLEYLMRRGVVASSSLFTWFPVLLALAMLALLTPAVMWFLGR